MILLFKMEFGKNCTECNQYKDLESFSLNVNSRRPECKDCNKIRYYKYNCWYNWTKGGCVFRNTNHFERVYDYYINVNCCDFCGNSFKNNKDRCLEHIHYKISGNLRGVACQKCNSKLARTERLRTEMLCELKGSIIKKQNEQLELYQRKIASITSQLYP